MMNTQIKHFLKRILSAAVTDVGRTEQSDHDELGRWAKKNDSGTELADKSRFDAAYNEDIKMKHQRLQKDCFAGKSINTQQKTAIAAYTSNGYTVINMYLRTIGTDSEGKVIKGFEEKDADYGDGWKDDELIYNDETIESLENFIADHPLTEDTMLYRTCGRKALSRQYDTVLTNAHLSRYSPIEDLLNAMVGKIGSDKGFMSTGYMKNTYQDNIFEEEILAPKGTPATLIESWSTMPFEAEVLVQRNLDKMVLGWEKKVRDNGTPYYLVRSQIVLSKK